MVFHFYDSFLTIYFYIILLIVYSFAYDGFSCFDTCILDFSHFFVLIFTEEVDLFKTFSYSFAEEFSAYCILQSFNTNVMILILGVMAELHSFPLHSQVGFN